MELTFFLVLALSVVVNCQYNAWHSQPWPRTQPQYWPQQQGMYYQQQYVPQYMPEEQQFQPEQQTQFFGYNEGPVQNQFSTRFLQNEPRRAIVKLVGDTVNGNVTFTEVQNGVHVQGAVIGLPEGNYGFHVHDKGDITGGCLSAGPHFNPHKVDHGAPHDQVRHVGDLGNLQSNNNHVAVIDFVDPVIALSGVNGIIGRTVVVHSGVDDLGRTRHPDSKKTGNAGGRVSCGVIGVL